MKTASRGTERERDYFHFYIDAAGRACVRVMHDESGAVLVQHKNEHRHWRGGWPEGLTLPYRFRELRDAPPERFVWIVDDERAADRLVADKRVATVIRFPTAAATSADEWVQVFRGRRVFIVPPNTPQGTILAGRLCELLKDVADYLLPVYLTPLEPGEGVHHWLERLHYNLVELDDFVYRQVDKLLKAGKPAVIEGGGYQAGNDGASLTDAQEDDDLGEGFEPMPLDALPPILARFAEAGAKALPCDPALLALPALISCAGAIGNTRVVQIKESWQEPCILWSIAIAPPSSRKTAAFKLAKGPLETVDLALSVQAKNELDDYEEELSRWELSQRRGRGGDGPSAETPRPKKPEPRKLIISDITVETAVREQRRQPRGLTLLRDEVSGWLASFGRYAASGSGTADVACWTECYEGGAYRYDRASGDGVSIVIPRCAVSIYGTIQPELMQKCFPRPLFDSGFAYRFMLAAPPRRRGKWTDDIIPHDVSADFSALVKALTELDRHNVCLPTWQPHKVIFDPDGYRRWVKYHDEVEDAIDSSQGDRERLLAKGKALCARLALVIHAIDQLDDERCGACIGAKHVEQAARLALWSVRETERVYGLIHADAAELGRQRLLEWLRSRPGPITPRDLWKSSKSAYKSARLAKLALDALVSAGFGQWRDRPTTEKGGRPTVEFILSQGNTPKPHIPNPPETQPARVSG